MTNHWIFSPFDSAKVGFLHLIPFAPPLEVCSTLHHFLRHGVHGSPYDAVLKSMGKGETILQKICFSRLILSPVHWAVPTSQTMVVLLWVWRWWIGKVEPLLLLDLLFLCSVVLGTQKYPTWHRFM